MGIVLVAFLATKASLIPGVTSTIFETEQLISEGGEPVELVGAISPLEEGDGGRDGFQGRPLVPITLNIPDFNGVFTKQPGAAERQGAEVSHCPAFAAIETARRYVSLGRSCFLWLKKFSLNGRREVVVV